MAWAAVRSAACNCGGNSLPRFAARRRIPAQARGLKKYRRGTTPVSKIADNEHTLAPLCQSEVLSVKNSVGEPIPEDCQPSKEGSKSPASVSRQHTGDVLPNQPLGAIAVSDCKIDECEVAPWVSKARSKSCD